MKRFVMAVCMIVAANAAQAQVATGSAAPDFKAVDALTGKEFSLSDYKGKNVVLEWTNFGCPFVKKHYDTKNMQNLQAAAAKDGVVWISVNSGAKDKQGYFDSNEAAVAALKEKGASPARYVRDETGAIGKSYGAKTTPHVYLIDGKGTLVYQGAIDDKATVDKADVATAKNYLTTALAELKAGKPVTTGTTTAYGCGVKYAN